VPDVTAIAAVLSSFNALKNIAQAMIGLHDTQALQLKIIEFNGALIDAQTKIFSINEERSALIERVRELEEQVADLEAWETEKQRYELKSIARGSYAYELKPETQGAEPPHRICAHCYQRGKKSILQQEPRVGWFGLSPCSVCPECKTTFLDHE
jgi:hypothetical protein